MPYSYYPCHYLKINLCKRPCHKTKRKVGKFMKKLLLVVILPKFADWETAFLTSTIKSALFAPNESEFIIFILLIEIGFSSIIANFLALYKFPWKVAEFPHYMLKFSLKHSLMTFSPSAVNNLCSSLYLPCFNELINFILLMLSMCLVLWQVKIFF